MEFRRFWKSLALVSLLLFFTLQKGGGLLLIILLPCFLTVLCYNLARFVKRPNERRDRATSLAIWTFAVALSWGVQSCWSVASRDAAEMAVQKVIEYRGRTGGYPETLQKAGLDEQALKAKWKLRYSVKEGKPAVVYPAPLIPLTLYEYDFGKGRWRKNVY